MTADFRVNGRQHRCRRAMHLAIWTPRSRAAFYPGERNSPDRPAGDCRSPLDVPRRRRSATAPRLSASSQAPSWPEANRTAAEAARVHTATCAVAAARGFERACASTKANVLRNATIARKPKGAPPRPRCDAAEHRTQTRTRAVAGRTPRWRIGVQPSPARAGLRRSCHLVATPAAKDRSSRGDPASHRSFRRCRLRGKGPPGA